VRLSLSLSPPSPFPPSLSVFLLSPYPPLTVSLYIYLVLSRNERRLTGKRQTDSMDSFTCAFLPPSRFVPSFLFGLTLHLDSKGGEDEVAGIEDGMTHTTSFKKTDWSNRQDILRRG
jgi:hypothetical protein